MQANHTFQQRITLPPKLAAAARPLTGQVRRALNQLTPAQRQQSSEIRVALISAGVLPVGLYVGGPAKLISFGGSAPLRTTPGICLYGTVQPERVVVKAGGPIVDGGCFPGPGGH